MKRLNHKNKHRAHQCKLSFLMKLRGCGGVSFNVVTDNVADHAVNNAHWPDCISDGEQMIEIGEGANAQPSTESGDGNSVSEPLRLPEEQVACLTQSELTRIARSGLVNKSDIAHVRHCEQCMSLLAVAEFYLQSRREFAPDTTRWDLIWDVVAPAKSDSSYCSAENSSCIDYDSASADCLEPVAFWNAVHAKETDEDRLNVLCDTGLNHEIVYDKEAILNCTAASLRSWIKNAYLTWCENTSCSQRESYEHYVNAAGFMATLCHLNWYPNAPLVSEITASAITASGNSHGWRRVTFGLDTHWVAFMPVNGKTIIQFRSLLKDFAGLWMFLLFNQQKQVIGARLLAPRLDVGEALYRETFLSLSENLLQTAASVAIFPFDPSTLFAERGHSQPHLRRADVFALVGASIDSSIDKYKIEAWTEALEETLLQIQLPGRYLSCCSLPPTPRPPQDASLTVNR